MASWRDVRRLALAFPATKEITSHERAAWTVGDKFFVWERPLRRSDLIALGERAPDGPILGVRTADLEMKDVLLASNPRVYFTTPHFDGYPAVLVQLRNIGVGELRELITEAWLARAPKRAATAFLAEHKKK